MSQTGPDAYREQQMTSQERVLAACAFTPPDRIPRMDGFFEEMPESWTRALGRDPKLADISVWCPDEGTFPTRARHIRREAGWIHEVDAWGRTIRRKEGAYFAEMVHAPLAEGMDIDAV